MTYDAVVLYYKRGHAVRDTLLDLQHQTVPPRRIVVVDNASNDGVLERLSSDPSLHFTLITLPANLGYAGGMNRGIDTLQHESPSVLVVTHEVRLPESSVERMLDAAEATGAAVVGPALKLPNGDTWSLGGTFNRRGQTAHLLKASAPESRPSWVDGSVMLISRNAMRAYGHFDESYFLYWEDVDLCTRLRSFGPIVVSTDATAVQDTATTPIYFATRNRILYWKRHDSILRMFLSVTEPAIKLARDVTRGKRSAAKARTLGIFDGVFERPSRSIMLREEA